MNRFMREGCVLMWFLVLWLLFTGLGAAQALGLALPPLQQYQIEIVTPAGEVEYSYTKTIIVQSDRIVFDTHGVSYTSHSEYTTDLRLIKSAMQVVSQEDQLRTGFDQLQAKLTDDAMLVVDFYLAGELQDNRKVAVPDETVSIESVGVYLQSVLLRGESTFHGNLYDINSGNKFNGLQVKLLTTAEVDRLRRQSNFPTQVDAFMADSSSIQVFSLGLSGLVRLFFPHRFYVVLESEAPYAILGFWGGSFDRLRYLIYTAI